MKLLILGCILFNSLSYAQWHQTKLQTVSQYRVLNGEIEAVNKATVSAQTAGRVEKINYDVDDFVTEGAILVEFTNTEQKSNLNQAMANAKAAEIAFKQAQTDYRRIKDIFAKKLVAKSQLDQALSNRNALQAKSAAAKAAIVAAKKQLEYTVIRAPYAGIVTNRYIEQGETVSTGTAIMEGLSLMQLRVLTNIPQKIIKQIRDKPQAVIVLSDGTEIKADKITIFPYAETTTRTFKARLDFNTEASQLFPGMTVKVSFKIGEKLAILIPKSTIITRSELTLVYVRQDSASIPRQIKTGRQYGEFIEVISGLSVDENILLNPLTNLATK
ncbi:hypothetical protein MNBD_GAMMA01-1775 [hydrothermal vent metagenome]|uniref:Uncharacterized protein n=1 Tax=hydrothermal vent metagenome TaxID=652676 RepID=A0A3B0UQA1_9ZZZZ